MNTDCTFCGSDVRDHDPVLVEEGLEERTSAGQFCNYACLARNIEEQGLETGACCRIDFSGG